MESYDEIFNVIKKWLDESLNISLNIPDDLYDGRYYLELLNKWYSIVHIILFNML